MFLSLSLRGNITTSIMTSTLHSAMLFPIRKAIPFIGKPGRTPKAPSTDISSDCSITLRRGTLMSCMSKPTTETSGSHRWFTVQRQYALHIKRLRQRQSWQLQLKVSVFKNCKQTKMTCIAQLSFLTYTKKTDYYWGKATVCILNPVTVQPADWSFFNKI